MRRVSVRLALTAALLCLHPGWSATTVATVGDSFADSVYLGMRSRPDLLKKNDIKLIRWSRPIIGLTRTDYFDYPGWLRDTDNLGTVDVCVAQVGANDLQSIRIAKGKWAMFASEQWAILYAERVKSVEETLRERRCRLTIWILQPGYEKNSLLNRYHAMVSDLQRSALDPEHTLVFEISTEAADYGSDGTHFSGPFCLRLGQAMFRLLAAFRQSVPDSCYSCHTRPDLNARLVPRDLAPLRLAARPPHPR